MLAFLCLHAVARRSGVWQCAGEAARMRRLSPFPPFAILWITYVLIYSIRRYNLTERSRRRRSYDVGDEWRGEVLSYTEM